MSASSLENRPLGRFHVVTFGLCFLIFFVDGLDYCAANVGASAIVRAFGADVGAMGPVFRWGFSAFSSAACLFGIIGDRFGRKTGILLGVLAYSFPALLMPFATSLDQVAFFRFLTGLGIGGVVPNVIALLSETAPKRYRVSAVMASFIGYSLGGATIGPRRRLAIPVFGWSILFVTAGVAGIDPARGADLSRCRNRSRSSRPSSRARRVCARSLRALAPELTITPETRFVLRRPANETRFSLGLLFSGFRRYATPLIWVAFFAEALTYMTLSAWFAVVLETAGPSRTQAALSFSYAAVGAMAAILLLGPADRPVRAQGGGGVRHLAVGAIYYLGTPGLPPALLTVVGMLAYASAVVRPISR